ncbi:MAG: RHS repeat-associated core domain-containing protein [Alphaproteobacteria bacterium]
MKVLKRPALLAASMAMTALLLLHAAGLPLPAEAAPAPPVAESLTAAIRAAHFAEPLVATAPTTPAEDRALVRALAVYEKRTTPDDVGSLTAFLARYPHSGWAPALLTDLGISYLHYGYFSRAIDAWSKAWREGRSTTEPQARAVVDRALGELARLYASLGHFESLAALFDEIGDRPVTGSATEAVQTAREELALVKKDPRHLFICGPMALRSLMLARGAKDAQVQSLVWYRAGPNGTSLAEVARLAEEAKFPHRLVFRKPGQPVPVPAVVHWKVGHFAAIVGEANGRFHVEDPVFAGHELWVTQAALDQEASGYFLAPAHAPDGAGWRAVDRTEAAGVWGKGPTNGTVTGGSGSLDVDANAAGATCPMCSYNIKESSVSVTLSDTPVGYSPPIGPSAKVKITYNQREDSQPASFSFFNVSPKWTLNWLTYVTDDPTNPGANVSRYLAGGGAYYYSGYTASNGRFTAQDNDGSILVLASQTPITYQRQLQDGSIEIYAQSNGSTSYPRNVFLSQVIDPQGNAVTLTYDSQERLTTLTDATGRQTTFAYGVAGWPLLVSQITDPFGRSAALAYDSSERLISITDVLGLTSSFTYDANSLVDAMTTPYGTTSFAYTAPGTSAPPRFVQVTDPLGLNEREEWLEPAPIPDSDPSGTVPQGMSTTNQYLTYRDSFHWDKDAYVAAGCTPSGGCDYTKARDRQFNHVPNTTIKSTSLGTVKYPLENRIWYNYPAQTAPIYAGTYEQPTAIGRVLDDGTTQLSQFSYDTAGYFKLTQAIDPLGRTTSFAYANHVDLSAISQTTAYGIQTTVAQFIYNTRHRPILYTDAAGQTTSYAYNAAGQLTSLTNPLGQTTSYQYDSAGDLTAIVDANSVTAASFTYDAFDRVATYTDSEGWTVSYGYDNGDRVTKITYPDGTADLYTYDNLDLASYQDRQLRTWSFSHDADRRLSAITDPLGHQALFAYNGIGELTGLTDPNGNTTSWTYDVESRLTQKTYADSSTVTYAYENTTSRLHSVLDALGQTKQYSYAEDDRLAAIAYANAVNPTPNVGFAYDPYFPRLVSMTDGNGTTHYAYVAVGALGALRLQQESSPLASSTIAYAYDALGRLASRAVAGEGAETFGYDAIGRLVSHASDLGSFALAYLGQTGQITGRTLASSTLATSWSYLSNSGDRRLAGIGNVGLSNGQFSTYAYTTTPENFIAAIAETSDSATVYPTTGTQTASYNTLNALTNLSGQAFTYDADGNLLSDGARNYTWDAENRLVGMTYPGQTGKATAFAYDGLGRRTAISSTPTGGGSAVTVSYLWCSARLCQARNSSNAVTREHYAEGELVPGSPAQPYYYGPDQLGSVRRAFASTSSAPAYSYDPYGNPLHATAPVTDFVYAGMFYNADSGLYLTQYRAYNPAIGRWLSRDPFGESSDPAANLYRYVNNDPVNVADPNGFLGIVYTLGATAEAGGPLGSQGAATVGFGVGGFINTSWCSPNFGSASIGVFGLIASFAGIVPFGAGATGQAALNVGYPAQANPFVAGAFAGRTELVGLTTANSVTDLEGPASVYSLNTPWFSLQFAVGTGSSGQSVYTLSVGGGGFGASVSSYTTETVTLVRLSRTNP